MADDPAFGELERFLTERAGHLMGTAVPLAGSRETGQDLLQTGYHRVSWSAPGVAASQRGPGGSPGPARGAPRAGRVHDSESYRKPSRKRRNNPPSRLSGLPGGGAAGSSRPSGSS